MRKASKGPRRAFGCVQSLTSGRFQASYHSPLDGRKVYAPAVFDTTKQADDWLVSVRAAINEGRWLSPEPGHDTLDYYASDWLLGRRKAGTLRASTASLYAGLLDKHITPYLGRLRLAEVKPPTVRQWYAKLGTTTGPTARAQAYRLLHTIMADAVRDGAVPANPCNIRGAGQDKHPERLALTVAELNTLAGAMPPRWRMMVLVAGWAGLRFGELVELRRRDILTDGKLTILRVERAAKYIDGQWVVGPPKTAAGQRDVTLPPHLAPMLKQHLADYKIKDDDALVFPTVSGKRCYNTLMSAMIRKARQTINRPGLHFHDLRHTGAVLTAQAGATLKELMSRLGQSTPRAAMIYQHVAQGRDAELARKLSNMATLPSNIVPLRKAA